MLILSIGLVIQISTISAQEGNLGFTNEQFSAEDQLRVAEPTYSFADDTGALMQAPGPSVWAVVRMIFMLALVAAAIYGIVFLLKKASKRTPGNDPFLKVLATTQLSVNRYAQIISVGSKAWLVGTSESGVNLISEIEDKEILDAMLLEDSRKQEQIPGRFSDFMSILRRLGMRETTQTPTADDIRKRRERLKEL